MTALRHLLLCLMLTLAVSACTNETDEFVTALDELSKIAQEHQSDCMVQGETLERHIIDNRSELKDLGQRLAEARVPDSDKDKIVDARKRFIAAIGDSCLLNAPILYAKFIDAMGLEAQ